MLFITVANADLLGPAFADLVPELEYGQLFMARVEGGAAVSGCRSPYAPRRVVGAGMDTLESHRAHGYATQ